MQPRQRRETLRPVLPRLVNFMAQSYECRTQNAEFRIEKQTDAPITSKFFILRSAFCIRFSSPLLHAASRPRPRPRPAASAGGGVDDRRAGQFVAQTAAAAARSEHPEVDVEDRCVRARSAEALRPEVPGGARSDHINDGR